jgi:hypothetical protein
MNNEEDSSRQNKETGNQITPEQKLGDFTTSLRVVPISLLAMGIGVLCAFVALALLRLIGLFTNLFYFRAVEHGAGLACWESLGHLQRTRPYRGRAHYRSDGEIRLGTDSRARNPGGDRSDFDER